MCCFFKTSCFQDFALVVDGDAFFLLRSVEGERMETVAALLFLRSSFVEEHRYSWWAHQGTSISRRGPAFRKDRQGSYFFLIGLSSDQIGWGWSWGSALLFPYSVKEGEHRHAWWWFWSQGLAVCTPVGCHRFACHCSEFIFGVMGLVLVSSLSYRLQSAARDVIFSVDIFLGVLDVIPLPGMVDCLGVISWMSSWMLWPEAYFFFARKARTCNGTCITVVRCNQAWIWMNVIDKLCKKSVN